jgi:lipoate-protein ligase B
MKRLAIEITTSSRPPALLLLEHPPVYTIGRKGTKQDLLWDAVTLKKKGIEVHWVDRGGEVTFHGPGQLVGYPLMSLGSMDLSNRLPTADYIGFLRKLEATIIRALAELGLATSQLDGKTGVWVQPDVARRCPRCPPEARQAPTKIASIAVKIDSHGVSRHGFAINISPDMRNWEGIVACGLPDSRPISLADLLEPSPSMVKTKQVLVDAFGSVFDLSMHPVSPETLDRVEI